MDLQMMVLCAGMERTQMQWRVLLGKAGFGCGGVRRGGGGGGGGCFCCEGGVMGLGGGRMGGLMRFPSTITLEA